MSERTSELTPQDAAEQSAVLYQTEKLAQEDAALTLDHMGGDFEDDDGGEQAGEAAHFAEEVHNQTVRESNEFGKANMDALHEAAIQEAAQRVADVYETSEPLQEIPKTEERAD